MLEQSDAGQPRGGGRSDVAFSLVMSVSSVNQLTRQFSVQWCGTTKEIIV